MPSTAVVDALSKLDAAIDAVTEARDLVSENESLTGSKREAGSEGYFGPVVHDLTVLRGRVADPSVNGEAV